jgi:pimeloyl-ACP methyl ester carboxylesterase
VLAPNGCALPGGGNSQETEMLRRILTAAAIATAFVAPALAQPAHQTGYAEVNGLNLYYEIHGSGPPVVLLHGAFATIDLWPNMIAALAASHQVIAIEQQGHGHTADIDRPLSYDQMADDTAALLRQLGVTNADFVGYSMGGSIAIAMGIRHPELVRKLVVISSAFAPEGYPPELLPGIEIMRAEDVYGTPLHDAYLRNAPDPNGFPALVAKVQDLERTFTGWAPEEIRSIAAPMLIIVGDSDAVVLEHAVEFFRLRGGGVFADYIGLPASQLAVLPATGHVGMVVERTVWIAMMTVPFLAVPMPD